jgi:predicted P-loop ATPase
MSFDQDLRFNPNSLVFDRIDSYPKRKNNYNQQQLEAICLIEEIEKKSIDITENYNNWIKIIYSLRRIFGDESKEYIHRVSIFYHGYSYLDTENQIEACFKSNGDGITGKTFFHFAKLHGFTVKQTKQENKEVGQISQITRIKDYIASKYEVRFNSVSLEIEFRLKENPGKFKLLNENSLFIELLEKGFSLSINTLYALLKSDFVISYDPFEQYFKNLRAWDGMDYIEKLANHIKAKDQAAFNNHFKKWIVRVVACALLSDYYNKQALILIGENQNTGKSTFCRFLCPPALSKYIAENISTDKDSRILLAKNLLINLDELALMGRSDLNSLKAYFSKTMINERLPWGRNATIILRRCSFIGSTNQNEFLSDETGSVRWLCFEIDSIDWDYKTTIDIDKVYAQAYYLFKSGAFNYHLTGEEIRENEKRNKDFQVLTIERELLEKYLDNGTIGNGFMTPTEIMQIINSSTDNQFRINHVQIGKTLKMLGYKRIKQKGIYGYNLADKNNI